MTDTSAAGGGAGAGPRDDRHRTRLTQLTHGAG